MLKKENSLIQTCRKTSISILNASKFRMLIPCELLGCGIMYSFSCKGEEIVNGGDSCLCPVITNDATRRTRFLLASNVFSFSELQNRSNVWVMNLYPWQSLKLSSRMGDASAESLRTHVNVTNISTTPRGSSSQWLSIFAKHSVMHDFSEIKKNWMLLS